MWDREIVRGNLLQWPKEEVGASIRACQKHANPANNGAKEWECRACSLGKCKSKGRTHRAIFGDESKGYDKSDSDAGDRHFFECVPEALGCIAGFDFEEKYRQESREQNRSARLKRDEVDRQAQRDGFACIACDGSLDIVKDKRDLRVVKNRTLSKSALNQG